MWKEGRGTAANAFECVCVRLERRRRGKEDQSGRTEGNKQGATGSGIVDQSNRATTSVTCLVLPVDSQKTLVGRELVLSG